MDETIRNYIKRRVRWAIAIGIGGWLLFAVSGFAFPNDENPLVILPGFLVFGGAIFAIQRTKCPRCSVSLGQIGMALAVPVFKPQPNFCPYCGVNFDEPRQQHQNPVNPIN